MSTRAKPVCRQLNQPLSWGEGLVCLQKGAKEKAGILTAVVKCEDFEVRSG